MNNVISIIDSDGDKDKDRFLSTEIAKDELHAFDSLFKKYWKPLLNFASYYLPDKSEREEVIQELFMDLFLKRKKLEVHTSVSAYLKTSAKNKILNFIRDQSTYKRHVIKSAKNRSASCNCTEDFINLKDCQYQVDGLLMHMPLKYRQVYALNREYQLTIPKTAQMLRRPVPTVEKQLKRVISYLRKELEPEGEPA